MRLPRPTYANVMATAAMFVALGGTSYAVARLPKASVGEQQLKDSAVTSLKIKDGTIAAGDLAASALLAGPRGARGAEGPTGPQGGAGPAGPRGPSDALFAAGANATFSTSANVRATLATLSAVPAGNYVIVASAQIGSWEQAGFIGRCWIRVNGADVTVSEAVIGNGPGATRLGVMAPMTAAAVPANGVIALECAVDQALSPAPGVGNPRLAAIRVETLKK